MGLLTGKLYDPGSSASFATTAAAAMAALDTTNLRLTFVVPANGQVLVRQRAVVHGATTFPQTLWGVLQSSTVISRVVPMGAISATALATTRIGLEALYVVGGLSAGTSLTWDAAAGTETAIASTGIKYGGPNNTTTNDGFGGYAFEIYDCPNCLGNILYDPASAVSKATSSLLALTAFDTTNARLTITAPGTGNILWRIRTNLSGAITFPQVLLGVLESASVVGRAAPIVGIPGTAVSTTNVCLEACGVITGLTPGSSHTYDAAYGVEIVLASTNIHYGGPNDTTSNNAWGALQFEIWAI